LSWKQSSWPIEAKYSWEKAKKKVLGEAYFLFVLPKKADILFSAKKSKRLFSIFPKSCASIIQ
jgi:hypothetical protein